MLEKIYQPSEVEGRIYAQWEDAEAFRCSRPERVASGAEPYCIVIPPPNVTGSLHMGHALDNLLQDILTRFERMRGKDVLWQPGMDHAGIATQMAVERQLDAEGGPGRREMGREAFLERVWSWKETSGGTIINQLKRLGASCDWSRERFTMDEGLSRAVTGRAEPYCIVIPPPNVTGSLHMGHALDNLLQDILTRFERMRGKDVLWQPGMDHAGIATQMAVERQLDAEGGPGRREMGREAFLERVWSWKETSGGTIINQLKRLGASCDWSRERFTMDEGLSRAVTKVFVELYQAGLIYKDKRLVNWDPKFQSAISDLEVIPTETKGHLWHFKYPIKGRKKAFITVATTRPETIVNGSMIGCPNSLRRRSGVNYPRR